jgi:hypothetical protein
MTNLFGGSRLRPEDHRLEAPRRFEIAGGHEVGVDAEQHLRGVAESAGRGADINTGADHLRCREVAQVVRRNWQAGRACRGP